MSSQSKEKQKAYADKYFSLEENKIKRRLAVKQWTQANPERAKERTRRWRINNKHRILFYKRKRRKILREIVGYCSQEKWESRCEYYGWKCFYCKNELTRATITQDHRISINKGGTHWPSNLVPACRSCNSKKRDQSPFDILVLSTLTKNN